METTLHKHRLSRILGEVAERSHGEILDLPDGATVEFMPPDASVGFCAMRRVIPQGRLVPLHSLDDAEAFLRPSGSYPAPSRVLLEATPAWSGAESVPVTTSTSRAERRTPGATTPIDPSSTLLITTNRLGQFFTELRRPAGASGPPTPDDLAQFAALAEKYGYWFAPPEENAAVGSKCHRPGAA